MKYIYLLINYPEASTYKESKYLGHATVGYIGNFNMEQWLEDRHVKYNKLDQSFMSIVTHPTNIQQKGYGLDHSGPHGWRLRIMVKPTLGTALQRNKWEPA